MQCSESGVLILRLLNDDHDPLINHEYRFTNRIILTKVVEGLQVTDPETGDLAIDDFTLAHSLARSLPKLQRVVWPSLICRMSFGKVLRRGCVVAHISTTSTWVVTTAEILRPKDPSIPSSEARERIQL